MKKQRTCERLTPTGRCKNPSAFTGPLPHFSLTLGTALCKECRAGAIEHARDQAALWLNHLTRLGRMKPVVK